MMKVNKATLKDLIIIIIKDKIFTYQENYVLFICIFSHFCRISEIHVRNVQDQSRTGERAEKLSEVERS